MKKLLVIFSAVLLTSTLFAPTYYASATPIVEELSTEEISEVMDRARAGITDLNIGPTVIENNEFAIQEDVYGTTDKFFTKTFRTSELLPPVQAKLFSSSNNYTPLYAVTTITAMYDSSKYSRADDESYSVAAYSTIYVNTPEIDGVEFLDLERVSGGWNIKDSQIAISNRNILFSQSGVNKYGLLFNQQKNVTTSSNAFSYAENTFEPVVNSDELAGYLVGIRTSIDIRDLTNGDKWDLVLENEF